MYVNALVILFFTLGCWTVEAGKVLHDTERCKPDIIDKIKSKSPPPEVVKQITGALPWAIIYSNYKGFDEDSDPKFFRDAFQVNKPVYVMSGKSELETVQVNWDYLLSGENKFNLKIHIWNYEMAPAKVFGYYLCKTKGGKEGERPHVGVAVSHGTSPGGIPVEAYEKADVIINEAATLFGIPHDQISKLYTETQPSPQEDEDGQDEG